jgi:hypothetical protein
MTDQWESLHETHATGNGARIYTPQFSRKQAQNWFFQFGHGSLVNLYVYLINAWFVEIFS